MNDLQYATLLATKFTCDPDDLPARSKFKKSFALGTKPSRHFLITIQIEGEEKSEVVDITENLKLMGGTSAKGFWETFQKIAPAELNVKKVGDRVTVYPVDLQNWMKAVHVSHRKQKLPK